MTKLDIILLYAFAFVFLTISFLTLVKNFAAALFIAFLCLVFFRTFFLHFYHRKKKKAVISVQDMETELSIMGTEQTDFFLSVVPPAFSGEKKENGFVFQKNDLVFVATNYRFSPTGADDVARFYRIAKKEKASELWILGRAPSRSVRSFATSLDLLIRFIPSKKVHSFLYTQNALMPKRRRFCNPKKPRLKTIIDEAFTKKRAKYFALSGLSLSAFAFFGGSKVYYFVFAAICLILSMVCALKKS